MSVVPFQSLALIRPLLDQLHALGYVSATPIQAKAIPAVLSGRDVLACAQTGTGKTAAFALPILQRLAENKQSGSSRIRVLVLAPTRELAVQIHRSFTNYGKRLSLRATAVYGGVGQEPQVAALRRGVDILVATPGRLMDLYHQRFVNLGAVGTLVLDEADRMLDMGFLPDVRRIIAALPKTRQNLLFSATMPQGVSQLVQQVLRDPIRVQVAPVSAAAEKVDQSVFFVNRENKSKLLAHILEDVQVRRAIVFTRTRHSANRVSLFLSKRRIGAEAIHGDKSQGARMRALEGFRSGRVRVLVATDIASRGIDVHDITHVINMDLPEVAEDYVHRIGRTARAGNSGSAWSMCSPEERHSLKGIERLLNKRLRIIQNHPFEPNKHG